MAWRVANSLLKLREQVNAAHPQRSKTDDGTIGDERHSASQSDHNPDSRGVVRAMDLTHDPKHGFNSYEFADMLRQRHDPRIKYVISNGRIFSSTVFPWRWRGYSGSNKHDRHVHVSVVPDQRGDNTADWNLDKPTSVPSTPVVNAEARFDELLKRLLEHEGGNDDDPRDTGGRTSRGITQLEYDVWRKTHPGLPSDVWDAPQSTVREIYKQNYWIASRANEMPEGVDYALFDYAVNSGLRKASKGLQEAVGVNPDGWIGPITMAAMKKHDTREIVADMADERMAYLRHRPNWKTYGGGWTTRVADVKRDATMDVA